MEYETDINVSQDNVRLNYLNKLNFTKNLLLDILPSDQEIKSDMQELHSIIKKLINLLQGIQHNKHGNFYQIHQLIDKNEFLNFIYFAKENEIYLRIKEKFDLNPKYHWQLFNRIYTKLEKASQKIKYLSEIESEDVSEIQKLLMEVAIIFNISLEEELREDKYLIRHLNGVYHYIRGDLNESLHIKGNLAVDGESLQRAKNEYQQALELDENLVKAQDRLEKINELIV